MKLLRAQLGSELRVLLRNGEQLLLIVGIPVLLLTFFSLVDLLPTGDSASVDFLLPGIIALAVMSTAMVSLGIATGFERSYNVLKRLGATPLGIPRLILAKALSVVVIEIGQLVLLIGVAISLGARTASANLATTLLAVVVGTLVFSGIGLTLAGQLRGEVNLAAQNGVYLVLLLLGGIMFPLAELPGALQTVARSLPSGALADVLRASVTDAGVAPGSSWAILLAWAVVAQISAARLFRWS
jgi:ABC-2 type transport system permease protein